MYQQRILARRDKRKLKNVTEKVFSSKTKTEEGKIIYIYRYASLLITSFFYLFKETSMPIIFKLGVVISLLFAARIVTDIYNKSFDSPSILKAAIIVEIIGITVLLFPTGGINSPFIWYALNPVLVAASYLSPLFCWINLLFYIICAEVMSFIWLNYNSVSINEMLVKNANTLLVLVLITLAVELLLSLTKRLNKQTVELEKREYELSEINRMLEIEKKKSDESLEDVMSLYQIVETFTNQNNLNEFLQVFADYAAKLTKTDISFFWMASSEKNAEEFAINGANQSKAKLLIEVRNLWRNFKNISRPALIKILDRDFLIISVKSTSRLFGLMGIAIENVNNGGLKLEYFQKQIFLSELSSVILERFQLEEVTDNLLLIEEQNRIANEMHDNVTQRMFSIACAIHAIKAKWSEMSEVEIQEQLNTIHDSSNTAMKELRHAIYRLSSKKRGEKFFTISIQKYFDEFSKLNNIGVDLKISGDMEIYSGTMKKSLYRIIYEASGNAVRHGNCKNLYVSLHGGVENIKLSITDDGSGFDIDRLGDRENKCLGIYNMKNIVSSFRGRFAISSKPGNGTCIYVNIPCNQTIEKVEGGVAL